PERGQLWLPCHEGHGAPSSSTPPCRWAGASSAHPTSPETYRSPTLHSVWGQPRRYTNLCHPSTTPNTRCPTGPWPRCPWPEFSESSFALRLWIYQALPGEHRCVGMQSL